MKQIPAALQVECRKALRRGGVAEAGWGNRLKWLRYYLDFCFKYRFPPRDPDSLQPYLLKLAAKGQSDKDQQIAAG